MRDFLFRITVSAILYVAAAIWMITWHPAPKEEE